MRLDVHPGANSMILGAVGGFSTTAITALTATGFDIGDDADVNTNGETFYWVAFEAESGDMKTGTYTGDGIHPQSVTGIGFTPDVAFVHSANEEVHWRTSDVVGVSSMRVRVPGFSGGHIEALNADGFDAGNSLNSNGVLYYFVCFKNVVGKSKTIKYAGDGLDNRSITGFGMRPGFVFLSCIANTGGIDSCLKFTHQQGDISFDTDEAETADRIQTFEADGFQVGTDDRVNKGAGTPDVYSWAVDVRRQVQGTVTIIG